MPGAGAGISPIYFSAGERMARPEQGVVSKAGDRVLSPEEARAMMRAGTPGGEIWRRLSPLADTDFYAGFGDAVFAVQGERLVVTPARISGRRLRSVRADRLTLPWPFDGEGRGVSPTGHSRRLKL